jgi:hypothetical protein
MIKIYNIYNNDKMSATNYNNAYSFVKEASRLNQYGYYIVICL